MSPECEDPPNLGVDLRIVQLGGEGTVGATRPWVHPHCRHPPPVCLNVVTDEGPHPSTRLGASVGQHCTGVYLAVVPLSHTVPIARLRDGMVTHERRKQRISVVP
jgi:hypothetical protein